MGGVLFPSLFSREVVQENLSQIRVSQGDFSSSGCVVDGVFVAFPAKMYKKTKLMLQGNACQSIVFYLLWMQFIKQCFMALVVLFYQLYVGNFLVKAHPGYFCFLVKSDRKASVLNGWLELLLWMMILQTASQGRDIFSSIDCT